MFRAVVVLVIVGLIHEQGQWIQARKHHHVSLRQAGLFFPEARWIHLRDTERGLYYLTDHLEDTLGCILTTSPYTDHIVGYSGPNNLLIALNDRGAVEGLEFLESGDTPEYVEKIKQDPQFLDHFLGWNPSQSDPPEITPISGATLTSFAIAESLQQRLGGAAPSLRFPDPVTLDEVQPLFPQAARLELNSTRLAVFNDSDQILGYVLRTSPQADNISGYSGPTECLLALDPDREHILGLLIRQSYDTGSYVDQVRKADAFFATFTNRTVHAVAGQDYSRLSPRGTSGATRTVRGAAEGISQRLRAELKTRGESPAWRPQPRDWALAGTLLGALLMSFTSLRGRRGVRLVWQLFLVIYVGLISHDLLSLSLLGGWALHGPAMKTASGLVLLAGAALIIPWSNQHQLYCHHICPHGAAQQILGKLVPIRWEPPARLAHKLQLIPPILLLLAVLSVLAGLPFDLADLEPFEAWNWSTAGNATIIIAIVGLLAAVVTPQAYCRFGCPTGALLKFLRSGFAADRWSRRDSTASGLLLVAILTMVSLRIQPEFQPAPDPELLQGQTMGTTWSVKLRDELASPSVLQDAIDKEFDWAESLTSHWRTNTDISIFNRTATTNALPVPWPVLTLARKAAEISDATQGAFDLTVSPLVRLWGFGPEAHPQPPPSPQEIIAAQDAVGWKKLDLLDGMMRKHNPALELDLSSIAKGWAIDKITDLLEFRGYTNFLVEAGGELRAVGRWKIAIEHPWRTCTLNDESIASSGTYRLNYQTGEKSYSHLIDPRTGRPVTHHTVSVSVRHATCALADAWATALNVLGKDEGMPLAEQLNLAAQFVVEQPNGKLQLHETPAWAAEQ